MAERAWTPTVPCVIELTPEQAEQLYRFLEDGDIDYWTNALAPVQQQVSAWRRENG